MLNNADYKHFEHLELKNSEHIVWIAYAFFMFFMGITMKIFHVKKSSVNFLLHRRQSSFVSVSCSIVVMLSTPYMLTSGPNNASYKYSFQTYLFLPSFVWFVLGGFVMAPVLYEGYFVTSLEYIKIRFNHFLHKALSILTIIDNTIMILFIIKISNRALFLVFEEFSFHAQQVTIALAFVILIFNGLPGILFMDQINILLMIILGIYLLIVILKSTNGFHNLYYLINPDLDIDVNQVKPSDSNINDIVGTFFAMGSIVITPHYIFDKFNSLKHKDQICISYMNSFVVLNLIYLVFLTLAASYYILNMCENVVISNVVQYSGVMIMHLYTYFKNDIYLIGFYTITVLGFSISTVMSLILSTSTILTFDIFYSKLYKYIKCDTVNFLRIVGTLNLIICALLNMIPLPPIILEYNWIFINFYATLIFSIYFVGMMFPCVNSIGACIGFMCGFLFSTAVSVYCIIIKWQMLQIKIINKLSYMCPQNSSKNFKMDVDEKYTYLQLESKYDILTKYIHFVTFFLTIFISIIASFFWKNDRLIDEDLIAKPFHRIFNKYTQIKKVEKQSFRAPSSYFVDVSGFVYEATIGLFRRDEEDYDTEIERNTEYNIEKIDSDVKPSFSFLESIEITSNVDDNQRHILVKKNSVYNKLIDYTRHLKNKITSRT